MESGRSAAGEGGGWKRGGRGEREEREEEREGEESEY
jgi:hypothetical protein